MKVPRLRAGVALLLSAMAAAAMADIGPRGGGTSEPLQWNWRVETRNKRRPDEVTLVLNANIGSGYIVYGSDFKSDLGPNPTRLRLAEGQGVEPTQPLQSVNAKRRKDPAFGSEYTYFENRAEFRQLLKVGTGVTHVKGQLNGQLCHEADGTCTLFRENFDLALPQR